MCGLEFSLAILSDGSAAGWGSDAWGQVCFVTMLTTLLLTTFVCVLNGVTLVTCGHEVLFRFETTAGSLTSRLFFTSSNLTCCLICVVLHGPDDPDTFDQRT